MVYDLRRQVVFSLWFVRRYLLSDFCALPACGSAGLRLFLASLFAVLGASSKGIPRFLKDKSMPEGQGLPRAH
jgi:hypothetical protein